MGSGQSGSTVVDDTPGVDPNHVVDIYHDDISGGMRPTLWRTYSQVKVKKDPEGKQRQKVWNHSTLGGLNEHVIPDVQYDAGGALGTKNVKEMVETPEDADTKTLMLTVQKAESEKEMQKDEADFEEGEKAQVISDVTKVTAEEAMAKEVEVGV